MLKQLRKAASEILPSAIRRGAGACVLAAIALNTTVAFASDMAPLGGIDHKLNNDKTSYSTITPEIQKKLKEGMAKATNGKPVVLFDSAELSYVCNKFKKSVDHIKRDWKEIDVPKEKKKALAELIDDLDEIGRDYIERPAQYQEFFNRISTMKYKDVAAAFTGEVLNSAETNTPYLNLFNRGKLNEARAVIMPNVAFMYSKPEYNDQMLFGKTIGQKVSFSDDDRIVFNVMGLAHEFAHSGQTFAKDEVVFEEELLEKESEADLISYEIVYEATGKRNVIDAQISSRFITVLNDYMYYEDGSTPYFSEAAAHATNFHLDGHKLVGGFGFNQKKALTSDASKFLHEVWRQAEVGLNEKMPSAKAIIAQHIDKDHSDIAAIYCKAKKDMLKRAVEKGGFHGEQAHYMKQYVEGSAKLANGAYHSELVKVKSNYTSTPSERLGRGSSMPSSLSYQ